MPGFSDCVPETRILDSPSSWREGHRPLFFFSEFFLLLSKSSRIVSSPFLRLKRSFPSFFCLELVRRLLLFPLRSSFGKIRKTGFFPPPLPFFFLELSSVGYAGYSFSLFLAAVCIIEGAPFFLLSFFPFLPADGLRKELALSFPLFFFSEPCRGSPSSSPPPPFFPPLSPNSAYISQRDFSPPPLLLFPPLFQRRRSIHVPSSPLISLHLFPFSFSLNENSENLFLFPPLSSFQGIPPLLSGRPQYSRSRLSPLFFSLFPALPVDGRKCFFPPLPLFSFSSSV